jgi:actin-related protein
MINLEKLDIFKIEKGIKNEMEIERENIGDRSYTFKIIKRRSPWTSEVFDII